MFNEELAAIREAEDRAEGIKKAIRAESRAKIEKAEAEADRIISEAEIKAREIYDALVSEGISQAESEYSYSMKKAEADAEKMISAALTKKEEVVDYLVERIVKSSVNS